MTTTTAVPSTERPALDGAERQITYAEALNEAIREEMRRDGTVFVMGEDVAGWGAGGVFGREFNVVAECPRQADRVTSS